MLDIILKNDPLYLYKKYRGLMKTGDMIEWAGDALFPSKMIRWVTKKDVNHVSTVVLVKEYTKRVMCIEALDHGPELTTLSNRLKHYKGKVWWRPLSRQTSTYPSCWISTQRLNEQISPKIGRYLFETLGKQIDYDYDSIFKQLWKRVIPDEKQLFCSELHYFALLNAGVIDKLEKAPRPGDDELRQCHPERYRIR